MRFPVVGFHQGQRRHNLCINRPDIRSKPTKSFKMSKSACHQRPSTYDDWGPEPLTADQRRDLLEIVDDRYDKGSLLITSQVPVPQWHDVIADPTLAMRYWIASFTMHTASSIKGDSLRRQAGEKKNHDRLTPDRPAAHRPLPWTAGTISKPTASLDQEAISSTHTLVSRVRLRT